MARQLIQQPKAFFSVPVFLAPAFSYQPSLISRSFSSSPIVSTHVKRGHRDKNKKRGVSAIRGTGPRQILAVTSLGPLPKPVSDPTEQRAAFEINENHGLYGFFNANKEAMIPPSEEDSHGRPWSKEELSRKGWDDLHKLYWVCVKELNMVSTRNGERKRLRVGYGQQEGDERMKNLKRTMHRIRQALIERHYAHFDAQLLMEEKYIYELFPDVQTQFGLDASTSNDSVYEDSPSAVDESSLDGHIDNGASSDRQTSGIDTRDQRQKLTE